MTQLTLFKNAGLPAVKDLSAALRGIKTGESAGGVLLKMDKTGHWVYGADQTEVVEGSTWAINPFSFVHGFIAWGDGNVLGERMVSVTEPLPDTGPAPTEAKKGWETQVGMSLKCMSGDDAGLEVRYSATSVGGKRAVQELAVEIAARAETTPESPVPVVLLETEHYQHKSYGRIFTPVFKVTDWLSMGNDPAQVATPAQVAGSPDPVEPPRRRRA